MAYRSSKAQPPPPPPPPPLLSPPQPSFESTGRYQSTIMTHSNYSMNPNQNNDRSFNQLSKNRSRSISNLSRMSNSNRSTDSAATLSNSSCSSSPNTDAESTTPHSMSPTNRLLDEFETSKIEMFYRSHKTFVYVGQCAASLLMTETELVDGGRQSRPKSQDWKLVCLGIPVLLFNRGDTRSRDKRQIRICIAEHGTGFQLWSDVIDNLSNYQPLKPTFHTMYLSTNHRKMVGFSFDNQFAALEFYRQVETIVANPWNISLTGPKKKTTEKFKLFRRQRSKSVGRASEIPKESPFYEPPAEFLQKNYRSKNRKPDKSDISAPCLFQHVTSVNLNNLDRTSENTYDHFDNHSSDHYHKQHQDPYKDPRSELRHPKSDYCTPLPINNYPIENYHKMNKANSSSTSA